MGASSSPDSDQDTSIEDTSTSTELSDNDLEQFHPAKRPRKTTHCLSSSSSDENPTPPSPTKWLSARRKPLNRSISSFQKEKGKHFRCHMTRYYSQKLQE